ncbi:hypothetical protein N8314_03230, partial [Akkermansiaceae bacterium]|nr:hypothetical protein [Akkermansiaceae bacterium]
AEVKANLALARASDGGLVSKVVNEALSDDEFLKRFEIFSAKEDPEDKSTTPFEIQDEKSRGGLTSSPNSLLTPGELVFNPSLAQKVGLQNLKKFNRTGDSSLIRGLLGSDASKIATVPGKGSKDTFAATLDRGSFVIKKSSSEKSGLQNFNTGGLFGVQSFQNGGQSSGGAGFDTSFFSELAKNVAKASIAFGSLKSIDFGNIAEVVQVVPILSAGLEGIFDSFSAGADALLSDEEQIIEAKIAAVGEEIASVQGVTEATKGFTEAASEASEAIQELPAKIEKGVNEAVAKLQNMQAGADPSSLSNENKAAKSLEEKVSKREFQGTAEKPDRDEIDRRAKVKDQRAERNEKRKNISGEERRELIANDPSRRIRKQDAADNAKFNKDIAEAQNRLDTSTSGSNARKQAELDLNKAKNNKKRFSALSPEARLGEKSIKVRDSLGSRKKGSFRRSKKGLLSFDDLLPKLGGGGKGKGGLKGIFSKLVGKAKSAPKDIASAGVSKIRKGGFKGIPEDLFGDGLFDGIKELKSKGNFKKISKGFFTDLVDQFKDPKKLKAAFTKGKNIPGIIAAIVSNPIVSAIGDKVGLKEIGGAKGFESGSTASAGAFGAASGAATGAATGAAIGSLIPIPVVGTLVGGIVGAVVGGIDGLFSGIKDQKIFNALSSLDKVAKEAAESIGDLGKVEELDLGTDDGKKKIDKFLSAQEKLSKSVIDTSNKLDDIEGGSSLSRDGIPNATAIGSVLGGPVGTVVGGAIDLAESEAISSAFGSAEESLTSWSQSLEDNSGNKIAQFLQPFVQGTSEAAGSISEFASSLEQGITESDLYKSTIGALSSGISSVTSAFSTAGSVINQQGFFGAASTATGATLSSSTGGFTDELKGLFTGQSGQEVRDDRTASVSGALVLEEQTKSVESFITSVNLLDTENLKSAGEALATLGQNSIGALFEIESAASKIAKLVISEGGGASEDFKNIDSLSDLSEQFKSFDKNADQTARVFKNLAANAANLESVNLEKAFAGITGEDQDFKNALKPFQVANKKFLETLGEEGKSIEDANDARNKELLKSIQAGIGTKDGLGDLIKGAQIDVLDDKGQVKKDAEGNKITRDAEVDNFDDVQKVISSIFAAGDKADPAKIEALTAAFGGNATEAQNVFNAIVQNTGQEQKRQLEIAKSTLLEKARQQKIKESLKLFDAFGTAVDKLNKGVSSITDKFTTVASNVNSEVEKILAGDTSITAGAKLNPFENIDAASKAEIEQGVNNISGAIGPGGKKALEDITNTLDFGKNLENSITTLIDNTELKLSSDEVSAADITGQDIVKDFESDPANAAALDKLPKELREQFLQGLSASVESSRQDGGTIGIKELKQSLVSGELTAGIDQFTDQTAAALAEVTNSLNVLNSAVINAANVQSEIAQITTQKELTLLGQREAFEDRFNKFLDKSVNAREQAESRLKKRLETTINAGGAGARGAAAVGIGAGETNVLDAASLTDRRELLQAEREELKQRIGEGAGQEGEVGEALKEEDTDELVKALADNQQALKGTNDALQQLGDDVSILAGIESELASIQESKLSAEQKVFRLNEKLAGAKTPAERKKILDEENRPIAALGKAKRIASGELDANLTEKDALELLKLDADPRKKSLLKASNTDEGEFDKLIDQALLTLNENNRAEGLSDVQADARKNDLNEVGKQALLDEADRVQAQKEGAVESQANDKVTALDAQFVLLTGNVKTAKDELALLTQEVIKLRGGEPNLTPNARTSSTDFIPASSTPEKLASSAASVRVPEASGFNVNSEVGKILAMGEAAEAAFMAKGGSDGIATPNVFSDIDTLKPDVNKIAQQNAVNKIFEEQPTQQQFLKETQSERVDRARDKNPLINRGDSRLVREIPKALEQGGLVLNDSAEKLLQASQALSGENDFADKVSKAADKLSSLPELKVNLDAKVGT